MKPVAIAQHSTAQHSTAQHKTRVSQNEILRGKQTKNQIVEGRLSPMILPLILK